MYNATKIKKRQHYFCTDLHMKYVRTWKNTKKQIQILRRSIHIGWVENYNTLHNTEYPLHLKPAAQPHFQRRSSTLQSYVGGPEINNPKKMKPFNQNWGRSSGTSIGAKNIQHMDTEKQRSTLKFTKAKSFFTPNAFVHNIISNIVAPIVDTQITKNIFTPKYLRNCSNHYQT